MFIIKKAKREILFLILSLVALGLFINFGPLLIEEGQDEEVIYQEPSETTPENKYDFSDKYYFNQLSPILKREFAKIYDGIVSYSSAIVVNDLTVQDLNKIIYILHFDCPELFYLSDVKQNYNHIDNIATTYYPQYTYTQETVEKMKEEITDVTQVLKVKLGAYSNEEIEKCLHDYLISNITYNQSTDNYMNIYGALIEGKANCKGYSSAFTYLARQFNIPCAQIIGYATDTFSSTGHSWNIISIEGTYYYLDVCWDDFDGSPEYGGLSGSYIFYNLPADKMFLSHNPNETIDKLGKIPYDNDPSRIYYKQTGFYVFDIASARNVIMNGLSRISKGESTYIILQCDTHDVYTDIMNNLQDTIKNEIESLGCTFSECRIIDISKSNTIILSDFNAKPD